LPQKTAIVTQGDQLAFCLGLFVNLDLQAIWSHIHRNKNNQQQAAK
tara:strand:- start:676 stop:813 length:138 start_codon:yes stop_codon:yes gene_type:complete